MSPDAAAVPAGAERHVIERAIARDGLIAGLSLALLVALGWWWLLRESAAMGAMAMHGAPDVWSAGYLGPAFTMWALMMAAMMLPSAAPMILLYARFARRSEGRGALAATAIFVSAYLAVWTLFSALAAIAQAWLVSAGALSQMSLAIGEARLSGGLLIAAGLYQLAPLKRRCLDQCRSPLSFVMRLWRPGAAGAFRLGVAHGAYCLGCCWALMLLLFAGGVMNLAWVVVLTLIVVAEKLAPRGFRANAVIAAALLLSGGFLIVGAWPAIAAA